MTLHALARPVIVGIERTGNYHRVLAHRLIVAGFEVQLISSAALARTREALHNGWDKNDPKDAQVILHMLRIGATMAYQDPLAAGINDLQELSNAPAGDRGVGDQRQAFSKCSRRPPPGCGSADRR